MEFDDDVDATEMAGDNIPEDSVIAVVLVRQMVGVCVYDGLRSAIYTTQFSASPAVLGERLEVRREKPLFI